MKLSDFVVREAIIVDLQATGKEEAIREIVQSLNQAGCLADGDLESVTRAILGREELGSTGIGQGVAVPHTRHPTVSRLIGTVALSRRGVDFAALDGEPVDIFFLLISPPNQPGDHLRGPGKYLKTPEGRTFRQLSPPGKDAGERGRLARGSRSGYPLNVASSCRDAMRCGTRQWPGQGRASRRREQRCRCPWSPRVPALEA